jgi:hypothetical protein
VSWANNPAIDALRRKYNAAFDAHRAFAATPYGAQSHGSARLPRNRGCPLCRRTLGESYGAVVELMEHGRMVRKTLFYQLHHQCARDWAEAEMKRFRDSCGDQPRFSVVCRVEVDS